MQPDEPFVADIDDPPCLVTTTEGAALLQRAERAEGELEIVRQDNAELRRAIDHIQVIAAALASEPTDI